MAVGAERKPLFPGRGMDEERATVADHLDDAIPGLVADPGRHPTDEHPG